MLSTSYLQKLDTICLPRGAVPVPPGYVFGAMGRKVFLWMGLDAPGASAEAGFVSLAGGCNFIYARSIIYIYIYTQIIRLHMQGFYGAAVPGWFDLHRGDPNPGRGVRRLWFIRGLGEKPSGRTLFFFGSGYSTVFPGPFWRAPTPRQHLYFIMHTPVIPLLGGRFVNTPCGRRSLKLNIHIVW